MANAKYLDLGSMIDGSPPVIWTLPEAASQTFVAGDLVYRSSGYITVCGSDPSQILGMVMEDGHNDSSDGTYDVNVLVATEATLFYSSVYHSVAGNCKIEATDLGTKYGLVASSNKWLVDKTDTSNTRCRVQKFYDALATTNGRVLIQILAANREVA